MSEKDFRNLKDLNTTCPKCSHPKIEHMREPRVDPQRMTGTNLSLPLVPSVCTICLNTKGKECKYYLSKKSGCSVCSVISYLRNKFFRD